MTAWVPPGTPIAVVAPCGIFNPDRLQVGMDLVRAAGHDLRPLPGIGARDRYLAGDDAHRLGHLVEALTSPDYGAVWIARGGYGLTRLIDDLPWGDLPPRPVLGFSDVTALFLGLSRLGSPCLHAPVLHSLPITDDESRAHLLARLAGEPVAALEGSEWVPGEVQAPLVGGNLALLAATCGTPWQLDAGEAILVLEDIGEPAYRIDRLLTQLLQARVLDGVVGVAVGDFVDCKLPDGATYTIGDVIRERLERLGVPIVGDLPIGHGARNRAFRWGELARLGGGRLVLEG